MLTVSQVAEQAGVTERTVRDWCKLGMIAGAVQVDIPCANGKTKKAWRVPEHWAVKRRTTEERARAIAEGKRAARERAAEMMLGASKWIPGKSDPVSHVWRNSCAKSIRTLAEEMGVSCEMVTRFYDMGLRRYVG